MQPRYAKAVRSRTTASSRHSSDFAWFTRGLLLEEDETDLDLLEACLGVGSEA